MPRETRISCGMPLSGARRLTCSLWTRRCCDGRSPRSCVIGVRAALAAVETADSGRGELPASSIPRLRSQAKLAGHRPRWDRARPCHGTTAMWSSTSLTPGAAQACRPACGRWSGCLMGFSLLGRVVRCHRCDGSEAGPPWANPRRLAAVVCTRRRRRTYIAGHQLPCVFLPVLLRHKRQLGGPFRQTFKPQGIAELQ